MKGLVYQVLRMVYLAYIGFANSFVNRIPINGVRVFIYRRIYFMRIGAGTLIQMGVKVRRPRDIIIGENTNIHEGCFLDGLHKLTIGDNVDIGDEVKLYSGGHDVQSPYYETVWKPITIGNRACIFARAMLVKGGDVGEGAVVAAGSVVTKDVEPYTIVGGIPAKKIGDRSRDLRYSLSPEFRNQSWVTEGKSRGGDEPKASA